MNSKDISRSDIKKVIILNKDIGFKSPYAAEAIAGGRAKDGSKLLSSLWNKTLYRRIKLYIITKY